MQIFKMRRIKEKIKSFNFSILQSYNNGKGFTLIEVLVATGLFLLISYAVFMAFSDVLQISSKNETRFDAVSVLQNQIEIIRDMNYQDVGIMGGYPPGKIPATTTVSFAGNNYLVSATVRNIDDPFDGLAPTDTSPADYKMVEFQISCQTCMNSNFVPFTMTTTVAPKGLETSSQNGSLFVNVIDASGNPVSNANVHVYNGSLNPAISINDTTNNDGVLQLIDIPTSTASYSISVNKSGYSSDQTYPPGGASNPNPVKPDATVASQQITTISFAIDKVSSLSLKTNDYFCSPIPSVSLLQGGTKLIGTNPNVLKYSNSFTTDSLGAYSTNNLEWDSYSLFSQDSNYDIAGSIPLLPLAVNPNTSSNLSLIMAPKKPQELLVTVEDQSGNPVNDAEVSLLSGGFNQNLYTGRYNISQTDWSNGSSYNSQSGNIDATSTPGIITLAQNNGLYATSTQWLISNTFDLGSSNTTFDDIEWDPQNQPLQTGSQSLQFQIAANNDNATWNFVGPDGTPNTYYSTSGAQINSIENGNRYLRYKVYLQTQDAGYTPSLADTKINFSSGCVPDGQAFFSGLASGSYSLTVQKSGYQTFNNPSVYISNNWMQYNVQLTQ